MRPVVNALVFSLTTTMAFALTPAMAQPEVAVPAKPVSVAAAVAISDLGNHVADAPAIQRIVQQGILNVVSSGTFAPDAAMTRGQFAAAMQRMFNLGGPPAGTRNFADIAKGSAIASAVASVTPYMNFQALCFGCALPDQFLPDQPVTRAEVAVTLVNILAAQGKVTALSQATLQSVLNPVADVGSIPPAAGEHIAIAVENNLLPLNGSNQFAPRAPVTRANGAVALDTVQQRFSIPAPTSR